MSRLWRAITAVVVLALCAGCKTASTGENVRPPDGGAAVYHVAVHTEGVPQEKVGALCDGAVALLERRLSLEGYSSYRVTRDGDRIQIAIGDAGGVRPEDLRLLVSQDASLAFRVEAGVEQYRGAVYPRKAPAGYRWFTKPIEPHDVVAGATYRLLAEDAPVVTGRDAVVAEAVSGTDGVEVLITLAPAAIVALQAALTKPLRGARVALTVNDVLVAMPQFGNRIDGDDVTLSGAYDEARARAIAAGLNAAIIPWHLELLTEQTLGPPEEATARAR